MDRYYIMLTGSKNNAGDFLIKKRAKELLAKLRPERSIVDFNGWEKINRRKLDLMNSAEAILLMGGPALQKEMFPKVYNLPRNLEEIRSPLCTMGIGWKGIDSEAKTQLSYPLSSMTKSLLKRIEADGLSSGVRDYPTLNVLNKKGFDNFQMTGCPAYYHNDFVSSELKLSRQIRTIAFSVGVSILQSAKMLSQTQAILTALLDRYGSDRLIVAFHHSVSGSNMSKHAIWKQKRLRQLVAWLFENNIKYRDISGSAEELEDLYSEVDLHLGFRVHAHIYMTSIQKRSILLSEDARGLGVRETVGGNVLNSIEAAKHGLIAKGMQKTLGIPDLFLPNPRVNKSISDLLDNQELLDQEVSRCWSKVQETYVTMKKFISNLP